MFADNLKTLRKAKGYSQEELATRLNVVRQTISKWEKGLSVPDADLLISLSEIFEVSVSELLGDKIEIDIEPNAVAEQLSRINEQLAVNNRRSRRIWKVAAAVLGAAVLIVGIILFINYPANPEPDSVVDSYYMSPASGFGVSSDEAKAIYDAEIAENIRTMLLQIPGVQDALVIVISAEPSPFRVQTNATASVQLTLEGGGELSESELQTIADLVKSAVPDIEYEDIAITG